MFTSISTVDLVDHMGNDLSFVNAARVSFNRQSDWEEFNWGLLEQEDPKLFRYLMGDSPSRERVMQSVAHRLGRLNSSDKGVIKFMLRNGHGSPFEHVVFTFRVHTSIAVAREWFRHRIASYNEVSTRYTQMEPEFYLPPAGDVRSQTGKPGDYRFEAVDAATALKYLEERAQVFQICWDHYEKWTKAGIAKEVVRDALPLGFMTTFWFTVNFRSLTNFLSLRTHETALLEIQKPAREAGRLAAGVIPFTLKAWELEGGSKL